MRLRPRPTFPPMPAACAALLAASLAAGCGGGTIGKQGEVRLVNAAGDAGALDLYAGDSKIASAVATESAGGYAQVAAGTPTLSVRLASSGASLAGAPSTIDKDKRYTVLAYATGGTVAQTVLADDEAAPPGDSARLRVFNTASAEVGSVDAYLSATDCTALGASNANAAGLSASAPGAYKTYGAAAATAYRLCVTGAGDTSDLRLDLPLALTRQQVATVVLAAGPGNVLVNAVLVDQQGAVTARRNPSARLRVVADAAAGAGVAVAVNGVDVAGAPNSPSVGAYTTVAAGALAASVRIGGAAVATGALSAAPGSDQTLLVAGSAAAPTVALLADDNRRSASTASPTRLRLVNGLNGLGAPLTLDANAKRIATGVAFGAASPSANVPAATAAVLDVTAPVAAGPVYSAGGTAAPLLAAGGVYTLFILGDAGAVRGQLSQDR